MSCLLYAAVHCICPLKIKSPKEGIVVWFFDLLNQWYWHFEVVKKSGSVCLWSIGSVCLWSIGSVCLWSIYVHESPSYCSPPDVSPLPGILFLCWTLVEMCPQCEMWKFHCDQTMSWSIALVFKIAVLYIWSTWPILFVDDVSSTMVRSTLDEMCPAIMVR
jgi:hypothetical protein